MITINIDKAKSIVHDKRRAVRAAEFAPLDQKIAAQIPGTDIAAVEAERQTIRDRHAEIQKRIEMAQTIDDLKIELAKL